MAHKTLIGGTAYEIDGGKTLVNGTAYSIDKGKTLVDGTAYEVGFGTPISSLKVGDSLYFKVNGVSTEFIIVHQGKPSSMYDASCNGAWLMMKNCYMSMNFYDQNINNYALGAPYYYLRDTFPGLLESDVRNSLKTVKIPYVNGNGSNGSVQSGAYGLSVTCFLLSAYEVGFTKTNNSALPIDGAKLDYFKTGTNRIAHLNGSAVNWWLRSPAMTFSNMMFIGTATGSLDVLNCNLPAALRPAFILPSDFDITNYL